MKILYKNEYEEIVYTVYNKSVVPRIGDQIIFDNEEYRVKDITWVIEIDEVIVYIIQNSVTTNKEAGTDRRLTEVKNAILKLDKKVTEQEKKGQLLGEELVSVRTYLRSNKSSITKKE